jgi:hypothetical protein
MSYAASYQCSWFKVAGFPGHMVCWHVRALLCAASELCQLVENHGGVCELAASHDAVRRYIRQLIINTGCGYYRVRVFFCGYLGGRNPIGWPHTIQLSEFNCRGSEALPHQ